jgi:hypothetical protein
MRDLVEIPKVALAVPKICSQTRAKGQLNQQLWRLATVFCAFGNIHGSAQI